jgi:hypothetical protein
LNTMAMFQYTEATKVNALLKLVLTQLRSVKSTAPGWEELLLKHPYLAGCDDHVKEPKPPPILLSRTPAVRLHITYSHPPLHTPACYSLETFLSISYDCICYFVLTNRHLFYLRKYIYLYFFFHVLTINLLCSITSFNHVVNILGFPLLIFLFDNLFCISYTYIPIILVKS